MICIIFSWIIYFIMLLGSILWEVCFSVLGMWIKGICFLKKIDGLWLILVKYYGNVCFMSFLLNESGIKLSLMEYCCM